MNSTEKYINENKLVLGMRRKILVCHARKKNIGLSLTRLLLRNIKSTISTAKHYPVALARGGKFLLKTLAAKGEKKEKKALVIGNGPSQGMLKVEYLKSFSELGNEIICINHWSLNKELAVCVPTWMVFSDPYTFSEANGNAAGLIEYINHNPSIKLVVPSTWVHELIAMGFENSIYTFIDVELPFIRNINPMFPRGYLSMTLYKALAWALHLGYKEIGVIGMDNTYIRNIFCDESNRMLNLETHAGIDDYVADQSAMYPTIATALEDLYRLFKDLECFPVSGVVNLDPYSLTDRFPKTDPNKFFGSSNEH